MGEPHHPAPSAGPTWGQSRTLLPPPISLLCKLRAVQVPAKGLDLKCQGGSMESPQVHCLLAHMLVPADPGLVLHMASTLDLLEYAPCATCIPVWAAWVPSAMQSWTSWSKHCRHWIQHVKRGEGMSVGSAHHSSPSQGTSPGPDEFDSLCSKCVVSF